MGFDFRILGAVEVLRDGRAVDLRAAKERSLLALLLLQPRQPVPVDDLTDALWDGAPPETATGALRVYVSHLRTALGERDMIATRGGGYCLEIDAMAVDASRFEALAGTGKRFLAAGRADAAAAVLRDALSEWRGRALADIDCAFARRRAVRLEEHRLDAVEDRIEADLALGHHRETVGELRVLTADHPLRERLWGQLMLALYRSGRHAEALRAYESIRKLMAEELGVSPSPALAALEAEILDHDPGLDLPATAAVRPRPLPRPLDVTASPFVGRREELAELLDGFPPLHQEGRTLLVVGEAGIGKTRLAARLAEEVQRTGGLVLYGRCDREGFTPYQPFAEALGPYLRDAPEDLVTPHTWTELSRVVTHVALRFGAAPEAEVTGGNPELQRMRLFEAVYAAVAAAAAITPVLMVVDDLHWADTATLLLFRHLARSVPSTRVLVLATMRPLGEDARDRDLLAALEREGAATRIELGGLSVTDVEELADAICPVRVDRTRAHAIHAETGGNAFFVVELLRTQGVGGAGDALPDSVRSLLSGRLASVSEVAQRAAFAGSVVGELFQLSIVAQVIGRGEDEALDACDELRRAGLIEEATEAADEFRFRHAIVRRGLQDLLPESLRRRMHAAIAHALEAHADAGGPAARVVYHLDAASPGEPPGRTAAYARRAGDMALAALSYEEAVRQYQRALDMTSADDPRRAEILEGLGSALWGSGAVDESRAAFLEATAVARQHGRGDLFARATLGYIGIDNLSLRPTGTAAALVDEAITVVGEHDTALRARLVAKSAHFLAATGPKAVALARSAAAVELARQAQDPLTLMTCLTARIDALAGPATARDRLAVADELEGIAERSGELEPYVISLQHRAAALFELGELDEGFAVLEQHAERASASKVPAGMWFAAQQRMFRLVAEGRWADAEAGLADVTSWATRILEPGDALGSSATHLFLLRWLGGRLAELQPLASAITEHFAFLDVARVGVILMRAQTGERDAALQAIDDYLVDPGLEQVPITTSWSATMFLLAQAVAEVGHAEAASQLYEVLLPFEANMCVLEAFLFLGTYSHLLGILAITAGHPADRAVGHLEHALGRYEHFGFAPWEALARRDLGVALASIDSPRAEAMATEASELGRRLAMPQLA